MFFYNTTKRRLGSADILSDIDDYYSDLTNLQKRKQASLSNLLNESYTDTKNRSKCLNCASQIYDSYRELSKLYGVKILNEPTFNWCKTSTYNLLKYTSGISEVKDIAGNTYTNTVKDLSTIWNMFKTYSSSRNNYLNKWENVYDSPYVRKTFGLKKTWKKEYITDVDTYETSSEPILPENFKNVVGFNTKNVFTGVEKVWVKTIRKIRFWWWSRTIKSGYWKYIYKYKAVDTYDTTSAYAIFKTLANCYTWGFGMKNMEPTWGNLFCFHSGRLNEDEFTIELHDNEYSEEFAESVMQFFAKNDSDILYFKNGKNWALCDLVGLEKTIYGRGDIEKPYEEHYNEASGSVKSKIYHRFEEIYFGDKYIVKMTLKPIKSEIINTCYLYLSAETDETILNNVANLILRKGINALNEAYKLYKDSAEDTRDETGNPSTWYPNEIAKLSNLKVTMGLKSLRSYANEVINWIGVRKTSLKTTIEDKKNGENFINLLNKRLNKDSGTIMLWYQDMVGIDSEEKNIALTKKIVANHIKRALVVKAINESDTKLFSHQITPKYIDIEDPDSLYGNQKFKKGDTVYILDDTHGEIKTIIKSVSKVKINTTSYDGITSDSDVSSSNLNKTKNVTRLYLNTKLSKYYSCDNDVSSLRVMKIF